MSFLQDPLAASQAENFVYKHTLYSDPQVQYSTNKLSEKKGGRKILPLGALTGVPVHSGFPS